MKTTGHLSGILVMLAQGVDRGSLETR